MGRLIERREKVLERGGLLILYRPRVEHESVDSLNDVQRLLLVLAPDSSMRTRLIAVGRKRLRERFWGFVDAVDHPERIAAMLGAHTYLTKTRGARHLPAARIAASGSYSLISHDGHTHFRFTTTLQPDREIDVASSGDFIVTVANPDPTAWGLLETPPLQEELFSEYEVHVEVPTPFPPEIQQRFGERRYIEAEPELLDLAGAELIFIDAISTH